MKKKQNLRKNDKLRKNKKKNKLKASNHFLTVSTTKQNEQVVGQAGGGNYGGIPAIEITKEGPVDVSYMCRDDDGDGEYMVDHSGVGVRRRSTTNEMSYDQSPPEQQQQQVRLQNKKTKTKNQNKQTNKTNHHLINKTTPQLNYCLSPISTYILLLFFFCKSTKRLLLVASF